MRFNKLFKLLILALCVAASAVSADDNLDLDSVDLDNNDSGDNIIADYFPEYFNLADENLVTPVKDQGQNGNAWTFAVMGAIESNYLLNNFASLDLSPLHTAWFAFNDANASSGRAFKFMGLDDEPVYILENGEDNNLKALALFARLNGPVLNSQLAYPAIGALPWRPEDAAILPNLPYKITVNGTSRTYNSVTDMPLQSESAYDYTPAVRITEALFNAGAGDELLTRSFIKNMIIENGAVAAGINLYKNKFNNNAYYSGVLDSDSDLDLELQVLSDDLSELSEDVSSKDANFLCVHNILITGWDDNYSRENFGADNARRPNANGAWIAQNSWGTDWGDDGYFYISYEEPLKTPIAFVSEPYDRHIRQYGNDLLGLTDLITIGAGEGSSTAWAGSALRVAGDHEKLREIGFYTTKANMSYEIYIYRQGNITAVTSPISNEQLTVVTGEFEYPGWHVVKLPKAITIEKNCMFSVIISLTTAIGPAPLAVETKISGTETENAVINTGSSFFSLNGLSWEDGTKVSNLIAQSSSPLAITAADACIKAFTYIPDPARAEDWIVYINNNKAEIQFPLFSAEKLNKKDIDIEAYGLDKLKYSVKLESKATTSVKASSAETDSSTSKNSSNSNSNNASSGNFYILKISAKIDDADPAITKLVVNDVNVALPLGGIKLSSMSAVETNPNKNVKTSSSSTYSTRRYEGCNSLNSGILLMLLALAALIKIKFKI